jgi:hypothetical protein
MEKDNNDVTLNYFRKLNNNNNDYNNKFEDKEGRGRNG